MHTEAAIAAPSSRPNNFGHGQRMNNRVARKTAEKQRHSAAVTVILGP
jgi:hypothetical protein